MSGTTRRCSASLRSNQAYTSGMARPARCLNDAADRLLRGSTPGLQVRTVYSNADKATANGGYSVAQDDLNIFSNPLHLYRAILRQCTYLPDPAARSYMQRHVKARYRDALRVPVESQRGTILQKRARQGLSLLLRANAGHLKPLERILLLTYGRVGKRRHEAMRFLREPNVPMDNKALEELSLGELEKRSGPTEKMRVLIKSQKSLRRVLDLPKTKNLQPEIPESNSWGRPLPRKRVKNLEEVWYADVLDSIVAPLPEPEWDRLRDLAVGQRKWEGLIQRRTMGTSVSDDTKLQYVQSKHEHSKETHNFTARFMQRLWRKVFEKCPVMRWDGELRRWQVQWGVTEFTAANSRMRRRDRFTDVSMFAGVDSKGKILPGDKYLSLAAEKVAGDITQHL